MSDLDFAKENSVEQKIFKFRDTRQERLYKLLKLVGEGAPEYYKDACRLLDTRPSFSTTTHLVSHLIREIESSLRNVLFVFVGFHDKPKDEQSHQWNIKQIINGLDISEENPIVSLWLEHAPTIAHGRAHRDNLNRPRPINEDFFSFWDAMETIFDFVLQKFEEKYLKIHEVLDQKLLIENPSNKDAKWLKLNVPNNQAALGYFFNQLKNPNWLNPLQAEGLFDRPPEPIFEPEKNTTFFPPWALSRFLVRLSTLDSADVKQKVGEILVGIDSTNFIIHLDILEAACHLPIDLAERLAQKEIDRLQGQRWIGHLLPDKLADLTVFLAENKRNDSALAIAFTALGFVTIENEEANDTFYHHEPQTRMDRWDYGQFVNKCWASLAYSDWYCTLNLFCDLLDEYLKLKYPRSIENRDSSSYIWHRTIEDDKADVPNLLISTIRNIAQETVKVDQSTFRKIIEILESHQWDVFERIIYYLLRLNPTDTEDDVKSRLLSKGHFDNNSLFHEYVLLLEKYFQELKVDEQQTILEWIDKSAPSIEQLKKRQLEWDGAELSDEDAEKSIRCCKLKWLGPLKDVLPDDWRTKYNEWTEELGHPDHPGYLASVPQTIWGEPEPFVSQIISTIESVGEIRDYLANSENFEERDGLSRELSQLVKNDLERFVPEAERFEGLPPIYVHGFLSGIKSSAQVIPEDAWQSLLKLINWVMEQPATEVDLKSNTDWTQTHGLIGDFISSLLSKDVVEIPFDLHKRVWAIVHALTDNPNPTPEYETQYGGTNMDPLTISLNTIRGEAFHTLFKYLYWCHKHWKENEENKLKTEVYEVLENHLSPKVDASLAVRAVYGEQLPFLISVNPEWVRNNLSNIFPTDAGLRDFRKSVWETFIIYTRPWDNVFEILRGEYEKAIERLGEESFYKSESSANYLAEHLVVFYAKGKIDVGNGGLLDEFYKKASDDQSAYVFWFLGRMLKQDILSQEVLERISRLVEFRIANGHKKELKKFGWIFVSRRFDPAWSLRHLRNVLEISTSSDPDYSVIETLSELATNFPRIVIDCVTFMVDGTEAGWTINYWSPRLRTIIETALKNGEIESSTILISKLAAKGFPDFRDLLR